MYNRRVGHGGGLQDDTEGGETQTVEVVIETVWPSLVEAQKRPDVMLFHHRLSRRSAREKRGCGSLWGGPHNVTRGREEVYEALLGGLAARQPRCRPSRQHHPQAHLRAAVVEPVVNDDQLVRRRGRQRRQQRRPQR